MNRSPRILLIEDDPGLGQALTDVLGAEGYSVEFVRRGDEGCQLAETGTHEVVITDLRLPGVGGLEVVRRVHLARPVTPLILMTAHGTTDTAIEAIKLGAFDYLLKPFEMDEFLAVVDRAVVQGRNAVEALELAGTPAAAGALIGKSRAMQSIYKEIGRVATKPVTVLIRGETGTGKELIARAIHQHSDRSRMPFIAINCAAIPETLLESELFGHERGAFTGAFERRIGRFEQADGGTLFLDEIGELGSMTQAKLLRVLQERTIQRLGGRELIPVDVRVLAATHVPLEEALKERRFREDLFYRLNQFSIHIPPLREHGEDIETLTPHLLHKHAQTLGTGAPSISSDALEVLRHHHWPGNIRELENVLRHSLLAAGNHPVTAQHIRQALALTSRPPAATGSSLASMVSEVLGQAQRGELENAYAVLLRQLEVEVLVQAMARAEGNQARASRWLGIARITLREKLRLHGLREALDSSTSTREN
jgi:DNA-binding NtrC family response regulator